MIPHPTPQQLRYLVLLAEHLHFGRAAAAAAVSQSTLSAGIAVLERQLDAALLDRAAGKRVVFTPLGLEIAARARAALGALDAVVETAQAARAPMSGRIRLGVIPTIGPFLLPRLMPALRQAYPRLGVILREDTTARCLARLEAGQLDLALLALPCALSGWETLPVAQDSFLLAAPPNSPLAQLPQIPLNLLEGETLLLLEDGHCLRDQTLAVCGMMAERESGPQDFAATSLFTLVQMVAGGFGVTLLPQLAIDGGVTNGAAVALRPVAGSGAFRTLALVFRPGAPRASDFRALGGLIAGLLA